MAVAAQNPISKAINGFLDFIGTIQTSTVEKGMIALFVAGLSWFACRTFYDVPTLQADNARYLNGRAARIAARDAHEAAQRGYIAYLQQQVKDIEKNDNIALAFLTSQLVDAKGDNDRARAQLDLEKAHVETTANYCGSALSRVLLDHAAGADRGAGAAPTPQSAAIATALGAQRAAAKAPILSCVQLGEGYAALADWSRDTWVKYTAFQVWFKATYPAD